MSPKIIRQLYYQYQKGCDCSVLYQHELLTGDSCNDTMYFLQEILKINVGTMTFLF